MNKKIMLIGSLVLILAMGLVFVGCKNDDDGGVVVGFKGTSTPPEFTFEKGSNGTTNHNTWVVNWLAADGAYDYDIVWRQSGTKTTFSLSGNYGSKDVFNSSSEAPTNTQFHTVKNASTWYTSSTDSTDSDLWSAVVIFDTSRLGSKPGDKGRLGILTIPLYSNDKNLEIVWNEGAEIEILQP